MKALTIKQPWADLIIAGVKDIENRTWKKATVGVSSYIHQNRRVHVGILTLTLFQHFQRISILTSMLLVDLPMEQL